MRQLDIDEELDTYDGENGYDDDDNGAGKIALIDLSNVVGFADEYRNRDKYRGER